MHHDIVVALLSPKAARAVMMKLAFIKAIVGLLTVTLASCHVFVPKYPVARRLKRNHFDERRPPPPPLQHTQNPSALLIRGGGDTADYTAAAQGLFGNLIGPSTFLAGSLVPLGFLAPPLPGKNSTEKRIRKAYSLLAVISLCNEAAAIVYATIASNKLTEIVSAPADSVFALIQRDYQLSWIATNVHFLFGLFGFLGMIGVRAFMCFPSRLNTAAAGIAVSALLAMCSVVNRGVSAGDGEGHGYASSILTLVTRYITLLVKQVHENGGVLAMASMALGVVSMILALKAVIDCDDRDDDESKKQK